MFLLINLEMESCSIRIFGECKISKTISLKDDLRGKIDLSNIYYFTNLIVESIIGLIDVKKIKRIFLFYQRDDVIIKTIEVRRKSSEKDIKNLVSMIFERELNININEYMYYYKKLNCLEENSQNSIGDIELIKITLVPNYVLDISSCIEKVLKKKIKAVHLNYQIIEEAFKEDITKYSPNTILEIRNSYIYLYTVKEKIIDEVMVIDEFDVEENIIKYINSRGKCIILNDDKNSSMFNNKFFKDDVLKDNSEDISGEHSSIKDNNFIVIDRYYDKICDFIIYRYEKSRIENFIFAYKKPYINLKYLSKKLDTSYNIICILCVFVLILSLGSLLNDYNACIELRDNLENVQKNSRATGKRTKKIDNKSLLDSNKVDKIDRIITNINDDNMIIDFDKNYGIRLEFSVENKDDLKIIASKDLESQIILEEVKKDKIKRIEKVKIDDNKKEEYNKKDEKNQKINDKVTEKDIYRIKALIN